MASRQDRAWARGRALLGAGPSQDDGSDAAETAVSCAPDRPDDGGRPKRRRRGSGARQAPAWPRPPARREDEPV